MSHDGRYLYVACEGSAEGINPNTGQKYSDPTNVEQTRNGAVLCPGCRENPQGPSEAAITWKKEGSKERPASSYRR